MEDQVYDGINDYLRYVRRWVRLFATPLTANSVTRVRLGGLEPVADPPLRAADRAQGLGRRNRRQARRASRSPATSGRSAPPAGSTSAVTSPASPRRRRVAHRRRSSPRAAPIPTSRDRAACRSAAEHRPGLNHTTFQLLRVHPRGGRAVIVRRKRRRRVAAGLALVGRIGSERRGSVISRFRFGSNGGMLAVAPRPPGALRPHHRSAGQRRHPRARLQLQAARLELLDGHGAVRARARVVR